MQHVAALTESAGYAAGCGGVMVEVRGGEHDVGVPQPGDLDQVGPARRPAAAVPSGAGVHVEPAPVGETSQPRQMRAAATLAPAAGPLETHADAELTPVRWIERAQFGTDRHSYGKPPPAWSRKSSASRT